MQWRREYFTVGGRVNDVVLHSYRSYHQGNVVPMATEPHRLLKNPCALLRTISPVAALLGFHGGFNLYAKHI